jgi:hypothetical protein
LLEILTGKRSDSFYSAAFFKAGMLFSIVSAECHTAANYVDSSTTDRTVPVLAEQAAFLSARKLHIRHCLTSFLDH